MIIWLIIVVLFKFYAANLPYIFHHWSSKPLCRMKVKSTHPLWTSTHFHILSKENLREMKKIIQNTELLNCVSRSLTNTGLWIISNFNNFQNLKKFQNYQYLECGRGQILLTDSFVIFSSLTLHRMGENVFKCSIMIIIGNHKIISANKPHY